MSISNRGEINETEYKQLRPKHANAARAYGLPKTHKEFEQLPKFRPIIDTTGTTHHNVGKYLSNLLRPLTLNDFTLRDSFETAQSIRNIPKELYDDGYAFVSFDVVSLFTNVPLERTINVIMNRIYDKKLIQTNLKKSTLKKLIKDTCTKTVFSCNNQLYEQIDGVSMGSSMGPLLANIIMTELEESVIQPLINENVIKFYKRYVDDTLLLIKPTDIKRIHDSLNKFDNNLKFTYDDFTNEAPHFLDIEIAPDGLSIYRKDTNTGQYVNFDSYVPWNHKVSWIRSLTTRAKRICSPHKLATELSKISDFASWNGFPRKIYKAIIRRTLHSKNETVNILAGTNIYIKTKYHGSHYQQLIHSLERKLRRCIEVNEKIYLKVTYTTNKLSFYTNMKDKIPNEMKSNVVYRFTCPGCSADYIGKTDRNLYERCVEHATGKDSAISQHLNNCTEMSYLKSTLRHGLLDDITKSDDREFNINNVISNTSTVDRAENWSILLLKEAFYIKRQNPILNSGLKASRDLFLFS